MSEKNRVVFPQPVVEKAASQRPEPPKQVYPHRAAFTAPTQEEIDLKNEFIQERMLEARIEGFDVGAIVVSKYGHRGPSYHPENWGVVTSLNSWHATIAGYKVLNVSWLRKMRLDSKENIEDLYLVHASMATEELKPIFDIQDEVQNRRKKQNEC